MIWNSDQFESYCNVRKHRFNSIYRSGDMPSYPGRVIKITGQKRSEHLNRITTTVVKCAAGTSEPSAVEVGLHQGPALRPFLCAIIMDALTDNIRTEAPRQMMFEDDVVLCAREKADLEV